MALAVSALVALVGVALAEEEEKPPTSRAVAIASTLIGSVVLVMTLYYFTNCKDADIRRSTYSVICETISIFCAVLIFHGIDDALKLTVFHGVEGIYLVGCAFVHFLVWYLLLQVALGVLSGSVGSIMVNTQEFEEADTLEKHRIMDRVENNLQCFAALMAHITGFASISVWSTMQQLECIRGSPLYCFAVAPAALLVIFCIERITGAIRYKISMLDAEESVFERAWEEETVEAENDVMCLTVSFTSIQALRFLICGYLADDEGLDNTEALEEMKPEIFSCASWLIFAGTILLFFVFAFQIYVGNVEGEDEDEPEKKKKEEGENRCEEVEYSSSEEVEEPEPPQNVNSFIETKKRLVTVVSLTTGMGFSWCYFFGTRWIFYGWPFVNRPDSEKPDMELVSILTALALSFASFVAIILLDKLADAEWTNDDVDDAIRQTISRMGILVGFAWEQCFSESVLSIAAQSENPHIFKMILALFSVALVAPAWKLYLLPMAHHGGWEVGFVVNMDRIKDATSHIHKKNTNDEKFRLDKDRKKKRVGSEVESSSPLLQELLSENKVLKGQIARVHEESNELSNSFNNHLALMRSQVERMKGSLAKAEQNA